MDGNKFLSHACKIQSKQEVRKVMHMISSQIETSSSDVFVYRFNDGNRIIEAWEDDGEKSTGREILEIMRTLDISGVMVVVSR